MGNINDVLAKVNSIQKSVGTINTRVAGLPDKIQAAAAAVPRHLSDTVAGTPVGKLAQNLADTIDPLQEAANSATRFLEYLQAERAEFESQRDRFRGELETFVRELRELAFQVRRLLFDREEPVDIGLVEKALETMPDALVLVLYKALDPVPLWREAPGEILAQVEQVPSLADLKERRCRELLSRKQLHDAIEDTAVTARITVKILELALANLPKDLTVHLTVFGGGGLTVSTHPVRLLFDWSKWVLELVLCLLDRYLEIYNACAAAAAERALKRWRREVSASLKRIEAAVS